MDKKITPFTPPFVPEVPGLNRRLEKLNQDLRSELRNSTQRQTYNINDADGTVSSSATNLVAGYQITTSGLPVSTSARNGRIEITFPIQRSETFESNNGGSDSITEIRVRTMIGSEKWVRIRVPQEINIRDLQVVRDKDFVVITGPALDVIGGSFTYPAKKEESTTSNSGNGFF